MPTTHENSGRRTRAAGAWCRLHLSTWIVLALLAAILALLMVPGDFRDRDRNAGLSDWSGDYHATQYFDHGWPLSSDDWNNQMLFFLN